ncbi:PREDICTED: uncharacterized protein LOC105456833 isoform X1 [Wasmannia auropunctata]|uniref:uncharacterized protein LOC105456833 isoform X1 n=1 Tax=Wasmannia auropunctata TaxID=64793 RepID=UPI0005EDB880|nr:PREDICTED: uncharacterized protein LOC105456833 isoform X1 [Wasmannia auropunctata]
MARWSTVLSGVFLALSMVLSLGKLLMLAAGTGSNGELTEADQWLTEIGLAQYRPLFKKNGEYPFYCIPADSRYRNPRDTPASVSVIETVVPLIELPALLEKVFDNALIHINQQIIVA